MTSRNQHWLVSCHVSVAIGRVYRWPAASSSPIEAPYSCPVATLRLKPRNASLVTVTEGCYPCLSCHTPSEPRVFRSNSRPLAPSLGLHRSAWPREHCHKNIPVYVNKPGLIYLSVNDWQANHLCSQCTCPCQDRLTITKRTCWLCIVTHLVTSMQPIFVNSLLLCVCWSAWRSAWDLGKGNWSDPLPVLNLKPVGPLWN